MGTEKDPDHRIPSLLQKEMAASVFTKKVERCDHKTFHDLFYLLKYKNNMRELNVNSAVIFYACVDLYEYYYSNEI